MESCSLKQRVKVIPKKHPWKLLFAVVGFVVIGVLLLLRNTWGTTALIVISTIWHAEGGLALMRLNKWGIAAALVTLVFSHAVNFGIDYLLSVLAFKTKWFESCITAIREYRKKIASLTKELLATLMMKIPGCQSFFEVVRRYWKKAVSLANKLFLRKKSTDSESSDVMTRLKNHLDDLHKKRSRWVYVILFGCGVVPRFPFIFFGLTAPAVFFIRYNRMGIQGWVSLYAGTAFRTACDLAIAYGLFSAAL